MRLACISTILGYPWGSPDRLWTDLAARSLDRGDAVLLAISALTADHDRVRLLRTRGAGLFLRCENSSYRGSFASLARRLPWRRSAIIENRLAAFAPDVVLLTQGGTYDALAEHHLIAWLQASRTPCLVVCHNNSDGFVPGPAEKARLRAFFSSVSLSLFVSTHNLRLAERHLGLTLPRSRLVQNPLAAALPVALPPAPAGPVPVLGLVGRIDIIHKGLDLLFEALTGLPVRSVRVVLTGRIEDPAALDELIGRHGLHACIEVRGPVPAVDVPRAYGELELFLLTSRYEGCASSMVEALMCGRPVLATDVGGVSDWIQDGVEGYVVPEVSPQSIRNTLARALRERDRWPAMGRAARARFDRQRDSDPVGSLLDLVDSTVYPAPVS